MFDNPDWFVWQNVPRSEVERLNGVPGLKWTVNPPEARGCVDARYHVTHMPLLGRQRLVENDVDVNKVFARAVEAGYVEPSHTTPSGVSLRPYQRDDIPFLLSRRASILGYEMRLGKTVTALCAAAHPASNPIVIVAPLIARDVWKQWCVKLFDVAPVNLSGRSLVGFHGFPIYFCHYEILDSHAQFLSGLTDFTLIIDEIHLLQSRKSQRISACSMLASRAKQIIGLSGTPMWSNPRSMWPILNLLSPGAWGTEFEFSCRYTNAHKGAHGWTYTGTNNEAELKLRLSELIVRRTWESVLGHLPPVTNVVEAVEATSTSMARVEKLAMRAQLESVSKGALASTAGYLATLRRLMGELKVKRAVELALQAIKDNHKVVLWTWHKEVAETVHAELTAAVQGSFCAARLRAEDTQDCREAEIRTFNRMDRGFMVSSMAVGGVGIDLSSATHSIFVELDWIPATIYQASMRTFSPNRPGVNTFLFLDCDVERRLVEVLGCNEACQSAAGLGYEEIAGKVLAQQQNGAF